MTDLNQTILQKASGETRLNPDEQRLYMGTFRERVLLVLSFEEATTPSIQQQFVRICKTLKEEDTSLYLKISPKLSDALQISYMKEAQEKQLTVSIIDEKSAISPYALLFHTDHAVNQEQIGLAEKFPELLEIPKSQSNKKKGFWQKLFGG